MTGPSFFQSAGTAPGGGKLIGTNCGVLLLGDKLKDDLSCCAPSCGCWCIAVIGYQWNQFMGDPTLCAACVGKAAFHITGTNIHNANCADHGGFGVGDTFSFNAPIGNGSTCSEWFTGSPTSIPHITLTLGNTPWVLGYSDSLFKVYWTISFQGETTGSCCDSTTPCYTDVDVPHTHTPPSGDRCASDPFNPSINPCDLDTGMPCPELDCENFAADPVTSCPDIVLSPFVPDFVLRNDVC